MPHPHTLGELLATPGGRAGRTVKDEMRANLLTRLASDAPLFPGIVGYDETVVPQVVNAILSKHNFILLGLRGQAKTRMLRALTSLLDAEIPVMPGCEIHDDPRKPICAACRARIAREGDETPIAWLARDRRYVEKLATPDVTIADMIGDLDPIKAARAGLELGDEMTMHYGLIPRANRGIFAINELPDLAGKVQVGLFNILQEGDVQIKGYPVRLPLDVVLVFSANPEDYTARGKIITPLKDRIGSEIRTHYPASRADAMAITLQEAWTERAAGELAVDVPVFVREVVEEVAFQARGDQRVDKRSGVSQRLPITCLENTVSNAEQRALKGGEPTIVPRVTDIYAALPSLTGKIELEYEGELRGAETVARDLVRAAIATVFDGYAAVADLKPIIAWFEGGGTLQLADDAPASAVLEQVKDVDGLERALGMMGLAPKKDAAFRASALDFILEGLVSLKKISRTDEGRFAAPPSERKARSPERDRALEQLMDDDGIPSGGKKKKYYN
ncbi:MAG: sigma 54-interacting transcriptional regulator [Acidobacteria bacterium]|nr:sigma 54-interacting transcriptional regulator [Acidobacteriota bacterium]MBP8274795.1 sigma 54-interacting transcriptional regulator [Acidobacteriota bacterium]